MSFKLKPNVAPIVLVSVPVSVASGETASIILPKNRGKRLVENAESAIKTKLKINLLL